MAEQFTGNFTQQEPIPDAGIEAAFEVMRSGRLHRYNLAPGEIGETGLLEQEFAAAVDAKYCLAVASGGYAMGAALRAIRVAAGDRVLTNAFTLAPVPGAIAALGAEPVFLEVTEDLTVDLNDLGDKARASGAKVLLLSHMRGHICDMERLMALCENLDLTLIEDCAHTMGAAWDGTPSGRFGVFGCYSTQTYKHINSGEGGLLVSDDAEAMARAILLSGSYMLYERHGAAPPPDVFEKVRYDTPNVSGRMDHLRAAILRPQLADLSAQVARWNARYRAVEAELTEVETLSTISRPEKESFVGSSIQFLLPGLTGDGISGFVARCAARGVELKWFGADEPAGFTSRYDHWRYAPSARLPQTDRVLAGLLDMRLPLTFSLEDCALIGRIIADEARATNKRRAAE
jgi:dTDP-4-amino-4,6-dideoxygalactose transaminase